VSLTSAARTAAEYWSGSLKLVKAQLGIPGRRT
jgi:hypothetical protein